MANKLAVIDLETDPFLHGRVPVPFVAGFYDGTEYLEFWGDNCIDQLMFFLAASDHAYTIYAHNGGKFDYFFMIEWLQSPIKVIGSRIAKAKLFQHELRDSYSIFPMPLSAYAKDNFDYKKMEKDVRHLHTGEISKYLKSDCVNLFTLVSEFRTRYGAQLTIGATAIKELRKLHPFDKQTSGHDEFFRKFFFGGRVEYFESGILTGKFKIYDVNSMYPHVMKAYQHPTGSKYVQTTNANCTSAGNISGLQEFPIYFAEIECQQLGAFPTREKGKPLDFNRQDGVFYVTSHELKTAIKCGRVQRIKILRAITPYETISFGAFVDQCMRDKIKAKKEDDKIGYLFAKLLANSSYGKFAQNPANFFEYLLQRPDEEDPCIFESKKFHCIHCGKLAEDHFEIYMVHLSGVRIWRKPAIAKAYFDVATAASITGAARAVLMHALSVAKRAVYCDTDSIICESLPLALHDSDVGAWKLEGAGNRLAIAGKKLYALEQDGKLIKGASKGAILSSKDIFKVARGHTVSWQNDAPTFSLSMGTRFVDRKIQSRVGKKGA